MSDDKENIYTNKTVLDCCQNCACDPGSSWVHISIYNEMKTQADKSSERGVQLLALLIAADGSIQEMERGNFQEAINMIVAAVVEGERIMECLKS